MFVDSSLHLNDLRWSGSYLSWTCENISFQSHKLKYLDTDLGQIQAITISEIEFKQQLLYAVAGFYPLPLNVVYEMLFLLWYCVYMTMITSFLADNKVV